MTSRRRMGFQLYEGAQAAAMRGPAITATGGAVTVCTAGSPDKAAITDKDGVALTNPIQLTNGSAEFWVLATVASVDLYLQAPGGQFRVLTGINESIADIAIGTGGALQNYVIPFSITDSVAATEKDTGYDLPAYSMVLSRLSGLGLKITSADSGMTIDFGTLTGETGADPNGFIAASSLTTAGLLAATAGALHSTNAPANSDANVSKSLSYTLSTSSDTAKGFILMPLMLDIAGA